MAKYRLLSAFSISTCLLVLSSTALAGDSCQLQFPSLQLNAPAWAKALVPPTPAQVWRDVQSNTEKLAKATVALPVKVLTQARDTLIPRARPKPAPTSFRSLTGSRGFTTRRQAPQPTRPLFFVPSWMQKPEPSRPSTSINDFLGQPRVK